ncbi:MAG TPA: nitrilase-related carbon-nitrogen hydrolase [Verrucomicrobiae bacterium]|jgi:apolipoprotein N-acyltransferase
MNSGPPITDKPVSILKALALAVIAVATFHLAYLFDGCEFLIAIFLLGLFQLARLRSARLAFYFGFAIGIAAYAPHLAFFWEIFGGGAIALWCILSFWLGLFLLVGRACRNRFGPTIWACLAPFIWTGIEFFRSELYYFRFSWLNPGYAFSHFSGLQFLAEFGTYGIGFLLMAWVAFLSSFICLPAKVRIAYGIVLIGISSLPFLYPFSPTLGSTELIVTGVQLEECTAGQTKLALDGALKHFPQTDLFVLSEYAFHGPVPQAIRDWCKAHHKFLLAGGEDAISPTQYYNTAFAIAPDGEIAFKQAKCVPVQLMKDGTPASSQHLWNSPWGKLGVGICYDASYSRVTDNLVRQGAQGLIFPTMDLGDWGRHEHDLHARIGPMCAAEYRLPILKVCSSGISQLISRQGRVVVSAPFPGEGDLISGRLELAGKGQMPPDRLLGRISVAITLALVLWLLIDSIRGRRIKPSIP